MYKKLKSEIHNALFYAVKNSFSELFRKYNEKFYYCTLIMAECSTPFISAWSEEALERFLTEHNLQNDEENISLYKWSYADSPYCGYGYERYFKQVENLFEACFNDISDCEWNNMFGVWISCMEDVMLVLDNDGLFGVGKRRNEIFVNAEVIPPDYSNTERAIRLNRIASTVLKEWLEGAEEIDNKVEETDYREIWHPTLCKIKLVKPVEDKRSVIKLKQLFYYNGDLKNFINGCKNPPFNIKNDAVYKDALEVLNRYPELSSFIVLDKI